MDTVVLTADLPDERLRAGDLGAVVGVYADGAAYEIEFVTLKGQTLCVVTVPRNGLRPVDDKDIPTTRRAAAAG